jgi:hypothetical protein
MVCFQTKNPYLGKYWKAFELKLLLYFMVIRNILRSFGIFVAIVVIWYISLVLVYCVEKNLATLDGLAPRPFESSFFSTRSKVEIVIAENRQNEPAN